MALDSSSVQITMLDVWGILPSVVLGMLASVLLYIYGIVSYSVFKRLHIKGPSPIPYLGNLLPMVKEGFVYPLMEWKKKYGNVFGVYFGHKPVLVVSDLDMLKRITVKDFHLFQNRWDIELYPNPIGKGIFFEKGKNWRRIRNIVSPSFSAGKLKIMCQQINGCAKNLATKFEISAQNKEEVQVKGLFSAFSMDAILVTAFGIDIDSQKNPDDPFVKNAYNIFCQSVYTMPFVFLATLFPKMEKLGQKLKVTAWPQDAVDFIIKAVREIVDTRRNDPQSHKRVDFLQLMLDAEATEADLECQTDINSNTQNDQKCLTEDEIIGQAFVFLIAGYETTGSALQYIAYVLAMYPEIQQKVYQEIEANIGDEEPTYENISSLKYLEQVIMETLRMYPIVPLMSREALETVVINNVKIEKGLAIAIPIYALHHDPDNYPNPEVFDPERFSPENKGKINPVAFHPFGFGPRICIGMRLAMVEAKCALVHVLRRVRLVTCESTVFPLEFDNNKIMQPKTPVRIKIEPR